MERAQALRRYEDEATRRGLTLRELLDEAALIGSRRRLIQRGASLTHEEHVRLLRALAEHRRLDLPDDMFQEVPG